MLPKCYHGTGTRVLLKERAVGMGEVENGGGKAKGNLHFVVDTATLTLKASSHFGSSRCLLGSITRGCFFVAALSILVEFSFMLSQRETRT